MPDIPVLSPRVSPRVQPTVDIPMAVTPSALGADIGDAVQNVGGAATQIHREELAKANQVATLDADNQLSEFINRRLYDAKTGVLNQPLGREAPAAVDQTLSDYDEHVSKVASGLVNDDQRIAFQRMAQARRFDADRQLNHYERGETERDADQVADAALAMATSEAVQTAGDPAAVADAMDRQAALLADAGRRKGLSPEVVAQQQAAARSATNFAVIEQLSSTGQDVFAKQWYDAHKDELTAQDAPRAARVVEAGSIAGQSQRITDSLVHSGPDGVTPSRSDLLATIEKDERLQADPRLRDAVSERVDKFLSEMSQARAEADRTAVKEAYDAAKASPDGINDPRVVTLMAQMDPDAEVRLRSYFAKDGQIHTNPIALNNLMAMAARDPQTFLRAAEDPTLITTMAPGDYDKVLAAEKEIRTKGSLVDAPGVLSRDQIVRGFLINSGFITTSKSGTVSVNESSPAAQSALNAFNARVTATERAQGRVMTPPELKKLSDEMAVENVVQPPGKWWGYKEPVPAYSIDPAQRGTVSRDLTSYAKTNPEQAEQMRANLRATAVRLGVDADRLSDDQYNRAFAQVTLAKDLARAGDRAAAQAAADQLTAILNESGPRRPPPAANADSVVPAWAQELNASPIDYLRRHGKR